MAMPSDVTLVALLRGVNVGRAKRVAMADLRALVAELGYGSPRTLLNSGNVVFAAPGGSPLEAPALAAERLERALAERLGVKSRVTVLAAHELATAVAGNPLLHLATDASRLFVSFVASAADMTRLEPVRHADWGAEALALGERVAYVWCPEGLLDSPLSTAIGRALGDAVTTRNWATVTKLQALAAADAR